MRSSIRVLLSASLLTSTVACSGLTARSAGTSESLRSRSQAATVLGAEHFRERPGSFLNILSARIMGIQVRRSNDRCPQVMIRGAKSLLGSNDPGIYVDGVRMTNTCILDTIAPAEVHRVEFYPMGIAPRPPYRGNPNGLILVFMRDRPDD